METSAGPSGRMRIEPTFAPAVEPFAGPEEQSAGEGENRPAEQLPRNPVARHWRGGFSLGVSYWVVFTLGCIAAWASVRAIVDASSDIDFDPIKIFWSTVVLLTGLSAIFVWQTVGTWRAASNHAARRRRAGRGLFWAVAAKAMLCLGAAGFALQLAVAGLPQAVETFRVAYAGDPSVHDYTMRVMRNGTEIEIIGGFKYGLAADFQRIVAASPGITVVHLNSLGGRLGEARRLYNAIRAGHMTTYVSSTCYSACTLAFAGGHQRWIAPSGTLGFHAPSFPGLTASGFAAAVEAWRKDYLAAGFDAEFVRKAFATPSDRMWEPTSQELLNARVVTALADGRQFALSGFGNIVDQQAMRRTMLSLSPILAAMERTFPNELGDILANLYRDYEEGRTEAPAMRKLWSGVAAAIVKARPLADDAVQVDYAKLKADQLGELASSPKDCFDYLLGSDAFQHTFSSDLARREADLRVRLFQTAAPRPPVPRQDYEATVAQLRAALVKRYPVRQVALLGKDGIPPTEFADSCAIHQAYYRLVAALPAEQAAQMMRPD